MTTPAQLKANKKHLEKLDDIKVRVPKGSKEKIIAYVKAIEPNMSLNAYIVGLIENDMQKREK